MSYVALWLSARSHARLWTGLVVLALLARPVTISARSPFSNPPVFPGTIVLPCLAAGLVAVSCLPLQPVLEASAARGLLLQRIVTRSAAMILCAVTMALGSIGLPDGDGARVLRNALVFAGVALVVSAVSHVVVGALVPWLWTAAGLFFGVSASEAGEPRWAWWSWILSDGVGWFWPTLLLTIILVVLSAALAGRRRGRPGRVGCDARPH